MTEPTKTKIAEGFALSASDIESKAQEPNIEALVASILSDKHTLSAEDLRVFEELLDDPDLDPDQRAEFLQVIWNIVVSIIDYQWENASSAPHAKSCESIENDSADCPQNRSAMVDWKDSEDIQTNDKSADAEQCRKGSP